MAINCLSLLKLIELGVRAELAKGNATVSNYSKLEEVYGLGVLEFKRRLALKNQNSFYGAMSWLDISKGVFAEKLIKQDAQTESIEVRLNDKMIPPNRYGCTELHIFLNNSTDAIKNLCDVVKRLAYEVGLDEYATLELIARKDSRFCTAQLNLYGITGQRRAPLYAYGLDTYLDKSYAGYRVNVLYPSDSAHWSSVLMEPTQYVAQWQQVFSTIWQHVAQNEWFYLQQLSDNLGTLNEGEILREVENLIANAYWRKPLD